VPENDVFQHTWLNRILAITKHCLPDKLDNTAGLTYGITVKLIIHKIPAHGVIMPGLFAPHIKCIEVYLRNLHKWINFADLICYFDLAINKNLACPIIILLQFTKAFWSCLFMFIITNTLYYLLLFVYNTGKYFLNKVSQYQSKFFICSCWCKGVNRIDGWVWEFPVMLHAPFILNFNSHQW